MEWKVEFHPEFKPEFDALDEDLQDEILARSKVLVKFGPQLGRPNVDTLYDSKHDNMKELRFNKDDGVWRVAFAFDPDRKAILLVAGDKAGADEKRFYKTLIKTADERFRRHLAGVEEKRKAEKPAKGKVDKKTGRKKAKRKKK